MHKKRRLCSVVTICALLGGLAWFVLRPHEATYEGKPLSRWLLEAYDESHKEEENREAAIERAVRDLGTNALPTLIDMASTRYSGVTAVVGELADEKDLAFLHLPPQSSKHETTVWALKILGMQASAAVPALIGLLNDKDPDVRKNAARCLAA